MEAVRLRAAGEGPPKIRARLEHLAVHTHGYLVPRDLYYIRNRARKKGDRSVSLFSAALGTALDIKPVLHANRGETGPVAKIKGFDAAVQKVFEFAARRVAAGLLTPTLCLCYGGELEEMRALPGYSRAARCLRGAQHRRARKRDEPDRHGQRRQGRGGGRFRRRAARLRLSVRRDDAALTASR